jgi:hypothetical protein
MAYAEIIAYAFAALAVNFLYAPRSEGAVANAMDRYIPLLYF